jgi:hypothetical protein
LASEKLLPRPLVIALELKVTNANLAGLLFDSYFGNLTVPRHGGTPGLAFETLAAAIAASRVNIGNASRLILAYAGISTIRANRFPF